MSILAACCARVLGWSGPLLERRAQGRPGAGRTHGPPAKQKQAAVTTGTSRTTGLPCTMADRLIRALPGDRLSCPRLRRMRFAHCADRSAGRSGPHDFAVRAGIVRPRNQIALQSDTSIASSAQRFVTIAKRPSDRVETRGNVELICPTAQVPNSCDRLARRALRPHCSSISNAAGGALTARRCRRAL
jgi:hypothetical protein